MSRDLKFHRRSIRLKNYDYSSNGFYFVTICSQDRGCVFGEIVDYEMVLNEFGLIVQNEWLKTPFIRRLTMDLTLDNFVIMPNHMHLIIVINRCRGVLQYAPTTKFKSPSQNLGSIIRGFKQTTTHQINEIRKTPGQPVWQSNYYDHIIRDDDDLKRIEKYIETNPQNWYRDRNNPGGLFI